ncbi:MAG: DegV family protein [Candidatus Izimaplasma sp.]|nr:DegV family protein [Candidatus Izimaplasma bacterium]
MHSYHVLIDSTVYLPQTVIEKYNIEVVSLNITSDSGQTFKEVDVTREYIIDKSKRGASYKTSQPSPGEFLKAYNKLVGQGADTIFVICISKGLSGTYQSALLARNMLDNPDQVICFDTLQAAYGNELLAYYLLDLINTNTNQDIIINKMQKAIESTQLLFTVENLFSLVKSGRLSITKALIGSVLRVKPIIKTIQGKLKLYTTRRTYKKVFQVMTDEIKQSLEPNAQLHIMITHTYSEQHANQLCDIIKLTFPKAHVRVSDHLGSVLTIHVGDKGFGIAWFLA